VTALAVIAFSSVGAAEQIKPQPPKPCPEGQVRDTNGNCVVPKGKVELHDLNIIQKRDSSSPR
jgi:hypothetical protein